MSRERLPATLRTDALEEHITEHTVRLSRSAEISDACIEVLRFDKTPGDLARNAQAGNSSVRLTFKLSRNGTNVTAL